MTASALAPITNTPAMDAYSNSLLEKLGDRDPLVVWREHADAVTAIVAGISEEDARRPERAGKWSIMQVLGHFVDTEVVYGYRIRMIVAHDRPPIQSYDQDLWATRLHYEQDDLATVLSDLRHFRARNLRLVGRLNDADLDREGIHAERGPESVRRLVRLIAGHDLSHRSHLQRIIATLRLAR